MKNLILSGGIFHPFDETSAAIKSLFSKQGFESTIFDDIDKGLQQLADDHFDVLTVNALRWRMHGEKYDPYRSRWAFSPSNSQRELIAQHVRQGGGLLAIHTASICFDDWPQWSDILGGSWRWGKSWHPPPATMRTALKKDFWKLSANEVIELEDELYTDLHTSPSIQVILESIPSDEVPEPQPLAWQHHYGRGHVFVDLLGHSAESILQEQHALLIQAAAKWLCNSQEKTKSGNTQHR